MGARNKGSDLDRSLGKMKIIEGTGFWEKYSGRLCIYGIVHVEKIIFGKANCK